MLTSALLVPTMWITVAGLLLGSLVVVLRTPLRLLNLRVRVEEVELHLAKVDAEFKKAVRRWGIEAKRAAKEESPKPEAAGDDEPFLPFTPPSDSSQSNGPLPRPEDPLGQVRRMIRERGW